MRTGLKYTVKKFRQLEVDITGQIHQYVRLNPSGKFVLDLVIRYLKRISDQNANIGFVYRIDIINPRKERKKRREYFVRLQRLLLFYKFLTHRRIRRYDKKARAKSESVVGQILKFLECRLGVVVFRLNIVDTMYDSRRFLSCGFLLLNGVGIRHPNYTVRLYKWLSLNYEGQKLFTCKLILRLQRLRWFGCWIYFNVPNFYLFDFSMWMFLFNKYPKTESVVYPTCSLDFKHRRTYNRFRKKTGAEDFHIRIFRGLQYK